MTGQNTGDVFVYNVTGNTVSNYKQLRDVKLNAGSSPFGIGVDCSDGNVWIADSGSNQVELLSTCQSQIIGPPITTGISAPNWLSFDPVHHWMYVTNIGSDSIEAISADSRTANNAIDCPMGITDYGTNGATPTPYTTKEFVSTTTITALNIGTSSNAAFNGISSVQLNGVAYGIAEGTSAGGVYWIQDIVDFKQLGGGQFGLDAIDNIWNFQSLTSSVPNDLHFNQQNLCTKAVISPSNGVNFYYCQVDDVSTGKYFAKVSLPFTIKLNMTTYTATSGKYKGNSSVAFSYTISQNGIVKMSQEYDVVSFNAKVASSPLFHVGGFAPNKIPNDVENVFTGFASLAEVTIVKISATMQLQYLSGASLVEVPHAYGNGGETGETVQNVHMLPASGNTATVASGTDDSVQLW